MMMVVVVKDYRFGFRVVYYFELILFMELVLVLEW